MKLKEVINVYNQYKVLKQGGPGSGCQGENCGRPPNNNNNEKDDKEGREPNQDINELRSTPEAEKLLNDLNDFAGNDYSSIDPDHPSRSIIVKEANDILTRVPIENFNSETLLKATFDNLQKGEANPESQKIFDKLLTDKDFKDYALTYGWGNFTDKWFD